jgi:hypothetical protein
LGNYQLAAGTHDLKFSCITSGYNVNRIEFVLVAAGVEEENNDIPRAFALQQNYPNPFNPLTVIKYTTAGVGGQGPGASKTMIVVYDVLGRQVATLVNEVKAPGSYEVRFDASGLASGLYVCRMTSGSFTQSRTMVLVR